MRRDHATAEPGRDRTAAVERRTVLRTLAAGTAAGGVAAASRPAAALATDLWAWLSNVGNADGVVDRTGQDRVTVEVGVEANGGAFGFGPAVVRVDPGATVVWEWTGEGGQHNVVADDGSFKSDLVGDAGHTFERTFEGAGVTKYYCSPHKMLGMKGAVVVGDVSVSLGGGGSDAAGGDGSGQSGDGGPSGGDGSGGGAGGDGASESFDYGGWFEGVSNFDGTVDATGQDRVTIEVGAKGNGGNLAFEPAAVHVDSGTTVVWEWTGKGGQHNVVAEDVAVESPLQGEAGATYAVEVEGDGIIKYVCEPHEAAGMKGAIVVGSPTQGGGVDWLETGLLGLAGAIVAGPFVASEILARRREDDEPSQPPRQPRRSDRREP